MSKLSIHHSMIVKDYKLLIIDIASKANPNTLTAQSNDAISLSK